MSKHDKPWTHEPLELFSEPTWDILDPNSAQLIATFHDRKEAERYLKWRNKKQAKRKLKQERAEDVRWAWPQ